MTAKKSNPWIKSISYYKKDTHIIVWNYTCFSFFTSWAIILTQRDETTGFFTHSYQHTHLYSIWRYHVWKILWESLFTYIVVIILLFSLLWYIRRFSNQTIVFKSFIVIIKIFPMLSAKMWNSYYYTELLKNFYFRNKSALFEIFFSHMRPS